MKEEVYYQAKKRAKAKKQLREHVITAISVSVVLIIINLMTSPGYFWAQWPMMGLGIGLIFHAMYVIKKDHLEKYEDKIIKKEMNKYIERTGLDDELELKDHDEKLELDKLPELREEWKDSDFV